MLKKYIPIENENIKIHGRTVCANPLPLFWNGSGIEVNVDGSELYFDIETDYSIHEQWIRIEINGYSMIRMSLNKGINRVCAFRGMVADKIKNVRLIKEIQPMQIDPQCFMAVHSLECDGKLYPVEEKEYKIEFIGDSITSGEGLAGNNTFSEWIPTIFTTENNYAVQTAKNVGADYRIVSQSGWGVYSSWDNNLTHTLPYIYDKVCGTLNNDVNMKMGSCREYDFSEWKPDCIVVNLGCNDTFAFTSPAWTDEKTGITYKQRLNDDGTYNEEDTLKFQNAVYDFIKVIRKYNPQSHILWCYGMIGRGLLPYIEKAVCNYINDTSDYNVSFTLLPDLKDEWIGANNHPNVLSHTAAANTLTESINAILK